jgi:hypothetical protein
MRSLIQLILLVSLVGCASPQVQENSNTSRIPALTSTYAIMSDGYRLPVTVWEANAPQAVFLALHGFNENIITVCIYCNKV